MKAARKARDMRLVDEKYAKYGPLRDFVQGNPSGEALVYKLEKAWNSEVVWLDPIMSWGQAMMIMFMASRAGLDERKMAVLSIVLLGIHPHLIVIGLVGFLVFKNRKPPYPKRTKNIPKWTLQNPSAQDETSDKSIPKYNKEPQEVDFVVLGTDFGSMYTAALLSRCGRKVLVLDEEKECEHGCLVNFDGLDFVIGDQTLPGGGQGQLYINQLSAALSPTSSGREWSRVGGVQGVHSVISINKGEPLISGSGMEEKFSEWKKSGVCDVKQAAGIVVKLQEAANILSHGHKLPAKQAKDLSWMDSLVVKFRRKVQYLNQSPCQLLFLNYFSFRRWTARWSHPTTSAA